MLNVSSDDDGWQGWRPKLGEKDTGGERKKPIIVEREELM
jgi:hypothetical protein